jgi:hypothetical protein
VHCSIDDEAGAVDIDQRRSTQGSVHAYRFKCGPVRVILLLSGRGLGNFHLELTGLCIAEFCCDS